MASISLKNISKAYDGGNIVIPDLDLEINDKEFVILVGPSGCGKSTTLRMIAGLEEITSGELYIGDSLVNDVLPKDRDIAMVFQNYALYPHMTVYKNMAFGLMLRKVPKDEIDKKVNEAAKILEIEQYLDRKPKALSGGQRQRVALGRALVRNPEVFLLDEPLSNLDAKLRTEMRTQITQLHQRLGTTFVYVTHDQTEAMTMADRIAVLKDGILQQYDTPKNLYNKPCNAFVAGFMGSPEMNFMTALLLFENDKYYLRIDDKVIYLPIAKVKDAVENYIGKEVLIGIRPEDIHCEESFLNIIDGDIMSAKVDLAEMNGFDIYLHVTIGASKMVARTPSRIMPKPGDIVKMAFDANRIHLFDKDNKNVICN